MNAMKTTIIIILSFLIFAPVWGAEAEVYKDRAYRDALIAIAKRAYDRDLTFGAGGDISVRVPGTNRVLIKATGTSFGDLDYSKISLVDIEGNILQDSPPPSHETEIHCEIYAMRPEVGAIMHMHSPYATAWATVGLKIPVVTQQSVSTLKEMAIVPYNKVGSPELVKAVLDAYRNIQTRVVMMENHGIFIVGTDLYDLLYKAELVENTARIAYLCQALGTPVPFSQEESPY